MSFFSLEQVLALMDLSLAEQIQRLPKIVGTLLNGLVYNQTEEAKNVTRNIVGHVLMKGPHRLKAAVDALISSRSDFQSLLTSFFPILKRATEADASHKIQSLAFNLARHLLWRIINKSRCFRKRVAEE